MKGQNVVVTGAAQGIGAAIAKMAIERGASGVALIDKNREQLETTVAALDSDCARVIGIEADLRRRETCQSAIQQCIDGLGRIDMLANNAGIFIYTPVEDIDDDEWDIVMDVCLRGLFHTSVAAAKHMRENGAGRIVNIASVDGFVALPEMAHYAAAKAGVISLTRTFAMEYVKAGVLVNAVAPGLTDTPRVRANNRAEKVQSKIPVGRLATAAEIADAVCYLGSSSNTYIAGEILNVSGGLVIA
jgi:3-oxoacyl-[acyl-carrier protein] reductase